MERKIETISQERKTKKSYLPSKTRPQKKKKSKRSRLTNQRGRGEILPTINQNFYFFLKKKESINKINKNKKIKKHKEKKSKGSDYSQYY